MAIIEQNSNVVQVALLYAASTCTVVGRSCSSPNALSVFSVSRAYSCPCSIVDANAIASRGTATSALSHRWTALRS